MGFEIFKAEAELVAEAQALLDSGMLDENAASYYRSLLKGYRKLFKTTRRLVRLSDQNEEKLRQAKVELEKAARLREDVDGIMRHDLKTPLNYIISMPSIILEDPGLNADHVEMLKAIEASGYRMMHMINLSLDLMKMERGTYPFTPAPVDLVELVRRICDELRSLAERKDVDLAVEVNHQPADSDDVFYVLGESLLCYSMLANLIKNAVEASPEGTPVFIKLETSDDGMGGIRICNSGTVPEAIRERFFDKYVTAGKSGGTGLGTYSARLIAETQQGAISLVSSDDAVTEITVRLQICDPPKPGEDTDAAVPVTSLAIGENLPPLSILLVDDDPYNLQLLSNYLIDDRFRIDTAENGKIAFEKITSIAYDIAFMDMEMPVLNGPETMQRVRTLEAAQADARRPLVAVALSAHDDTATRERCLKAGFDTYLQKPVRKITIVQTLHRFFAPDQAATESLEGSVSCGGPALKEVDRGEDETAYTVTIDADLEDMIPAFLESKRAELEDLRSIFDRGDFDQVRQLGHRLKGTFNMYGFAFLSNCCLSIETAAPDEDADTVADALDKAMAFMDQMTITYVEES